MVQLQERSANAVGGKTARACDSCVRRRARWYCAADDAFLCQACDSAVHSANPLARRHDRVRLKTSSSSTITQAAARAEAFWDRNSSPLPAWHQRKARTPRHGKGGGGGPAAKPAAPLVPDLETNANRSSNDDEVEVGTAVEEEEQLLYRVPIFDPVLSEFCSPPALFEESNPSAEESKPEVHHQLQSAENQNHGFAGFNPADVELAEFAADVENLLGQGLDNDSFSIDGLGLLDACSEDDKQHVKAELADAIMGSGDNVNFLVDMELESSRESFEFNFECGSPAAGDDAEEQKSQTMSQGCNGVVMKKMGLRLDYEAVIAAWSPRACSPWTDGTRPQFDLDDCWPDFMGMCGGVRGGSGGVHVGGYGDQAGLGVQAAGNPDGGREARVSRYREKRRTRLFAKKIRYEVRKLNAEKRPRMKGRFVKRATFPPPGVAAAAATVQPFAYV